MDTEKPTASLILGAGWSYVAGLPLTKDLFRVAVSAASNESEHRLRQVAATYWAWAETNDPGNGELFLEHVYQSKVLPWDWAVEYVSTVLSNPVPGDTPAKRNLRYFQRLTRDTYCRSHIQFLEDALAQYRLQGVLTTNYDLLAERVLRHRPMTRPHRPGFHYGGLPSPQQAWGVAQPFSVQQPDRLVELTGNIPLFKLHGSLNWEKRGSGVAIYQDLRLAFRSGGAAEIVPPLPEKSAPQWLRNVWQASAACLKDSEVWVVVGFSLPPYDLAIRQLFEESAASGAVKKVIVIDPYAAELKERWASVAPAAQIELDTEGLTNCAPSPEITNAPFGTRAAPNPQPPLPGLL